MYDLEAWSLLLGHSTSTALHNDVPDHHDEAALTERFLQVTLYLRLMCAETRPNSKQQP
jgi:hypothetical protein